MGFTKAKSRTRIANATMLTHQEATASSHGPEKLGLDTVQLGEGCIPRRSIRSVLGNRDLFLGQDIIQASNKSLLEWGEVLS